MTKPIEIGEGPQPKPRTKKGRKALPPEERKNQRLCMYYTQAELRELADLLKMPQDSKLVDIQHELRRWLKVQVTRTQIRTGLMQPHEFFTVT